MSTGNAAKVSFVKSVALIFVQYSPWSPVPPLTAAVLTKEVLTTGLLTAPILAAKARIETEFVTVIGVR